MNGLNFRVQAAFLLSFLFFLLAAFRPVGLNHDTGLYIAQVKAYFIEDGVRYPDLLFNGLAKLISSIVGSFSPSGEGTGRVFLVIMALFESVLMFTILRRKKSAVEATLMAFGFGPLIFLDIMRQGTAMLLAGVFFSGKTRKYLLMVGALATHVVAVVSLLLLSLTKKNAWILAILAAVMALVVVFVLQHALTLRYDYYMRTGGYLLGKGDFSLEKVMGMFSVSNIIVLLFMFFGYKVGSFTLQESVVVVMLYLLSIYIPLLYRLYLFYFFCMASSRDMLRTGDQIAGFLSLKQIMGVMFNMGYAIILLRFSIGAFVYFDPK